MNIASTVGNMLSSNLRNKIGQLMIQRCWYSPRRLPSRLKDRETSLSSVFGDDIIEQNNNNIPEVLDAKITFPMGDKMSYPKDDAPSVDAIREQCQSIVAETAKEWEQKKIKEHEDFLLPSQKEKRFIDNIDEQIKKSNTVTELFNTYKKYFVQCQETQCILILKKLAAFCLKGVVQPKELHEMTAYKVLLFYLYKTVRTLSNEEVLKLLEYFTIMKVETKSLISQCLLQMMKHQINYMGMPQLMTLHTVLSVHEDIPLVIALRSAVVSMMRNECQKPHPVSGDRDTLEVIHFCNQNNVNMDRLLDDVTELNLSAAMETDYKCATLYAYLKTILSPTSNVDLGPPYQKALKFILEHLADQDGIALCLRDWKNLSPLLLTGLCIPLTPEAMNFLNNIYGLARKMNEWNFDQKFTFLKDFEALGYINADAVNDMIVSVAMEKNVVSHEALRRTLMWTFYSNPSLENELIGYFSSHFDFSTIEYNTDWLHVALALLLKNKCPETFLNFIFSHDNLSQCLKDDENIYDNTLNLNRIIHLLPDTASIPVLNEFKEELADAIVEFPSETTTVFKFAFKELLKKRVIAGVVSNKSILIDYMMVLNKRYKPLVIGKNDFRKVKHVEFPTHILKVAVLEVPSILNFKPANILAGSVQADRQILESEGYRVILLKEDLLIDGKLYKINDIVKDQLIDAKINITIIPENEIKPSKTDYSLDLFVCEDHLDLPPSSKPIIRRIPKNKDATNSYTS